MSPEAPRDIKLPHEEIPRGNGTHEILHTEKIGSVTFEYEEIDFDGKERPHVGSSKVMRFTPDTNDYNETVFFSGFSTRGGHNPKFLAHVSETMNTRLHTWDQLEGLKIGNIVYEHEEPIFGEYQEDVRTPMDKFMGTGIRPNSRKNEQLKKIMAIDTLMKYEGVDVADIVAHSEGCIHAILSAWLRPGFYKNLVLMNPAGLIPMEQHELVVQGIQEGALRKKSPHYDNQENIFLEKIGKVIELVGNAKVLTNSVEGISEISKENILWNLIEDIKDSETTVSIAYTDDDKLFRPELYEESAVKYAKKPIEEVFDRTFRLPGDHSSLMNSKNIDLINTILSGGTIEDADVSLPESKEEKSIAA